MPEVQVDDLNVVWDAAGPEDAEPVLLINGLAAVRQSWHLQVESLSRRYRVYSYDNRDVGETGPGAGTGQYGVDRLARDTAGLIDALGLGPVHVIGASMGGAIAQQLLLDRPNLVRSAQIVCSWPRTDPWLADLFTQWKTMYRAMGPLAWAQNSWLWVFTHRWFRDPDRLETMRRDAATYAYPQSAEMFDRQSNAAIAFDIAGRLGEIDAPVHVIAGAEDIFTPARYSEAIAAGISGARLTILPEVGHGMFWETPEAFDGALGEFLESQTS